MLIRLKVPNGDIGYNSLHQIHTFGNSAERKNCAINVGTDTPTMYIMKRGQKKVILKVHRGHHTQSN